MQLNANATYWMNRRDVFFLKVFKRGQMVSIHVENYCEVEPKISNGLIKND